MAARQRGNSWMADFMWKGTRHREPFDTEAEAKKWEEEARFRLGRGEPLPPAKNKRTETGAKLETLQQMFDHVKRTQWASMESSRHLIKNGLDIITLLGPSTLITDVSKADLDEAYAEILDSGLCIGTANRKMSAISKMLTAAVDNGIITRKPKIPHQKESEGRIRYINVEEELLITGLFAQWGAGWMVDFTIFQIETGLRLSETLRVEWRDISPDGKTLHVWKTKNKLNRSVPLSKRAKEALARLKKDRGDLAGPFVETAPTGTMRTLWTNMQAHLNGDLEEGEVGQFDDVTIHILRHTCASRMCQMPGVNLQYVQKFLGHKNIKTTMRYAHLASSSLDHCTKALEDYFTNGVAELKKKHHEGAPT
ncbi:site-specific integrase [Hyphomicrobium sp. ghe19]|uniref:tyrosine-type recombinase/integrase n=1 Tax=Hyphomicrobium sp. ghe19 TaxID=2682968 RepID=UPI00136767C9|nr:Tyrosine recombinase XerC [Hyphomicrobium sp. ghe19]